MPEAVNLAAAEQARKRGIRVILNAAPFRPLSKPFVQLVDVLVVNAVEAEMMGTGHVCCLASASAAAHLKALRPGGDDDDTPVQIPAENVTVVSSHGAGDAFIGALAAALLQGQCIEAACRLASSAAARHVAGLA